MKQTNSSGLFFSIFDHNPPGLRGFRSWERSGSVGILQKGEAWCTYNFYFVNMGSPVFTTHSKLLLANWSTNLKKFMAQFKSYWPKLMAQFKSYWPKLTLKYSFWKVPRYLQFQAVDSLWKVCQFHKLKRKLVLGFSILLANWSSNCWKVQARPKTCWPRATRLVRVVNAGDHCWLVWLIVSPYCILICINPIVNSMWYVVKSIL